MQRIFITYSHIKFIGYKADCNIILVVFNIMHSIPIFFFLSWLSKNNVK